MCVVLVHIIEAKDVRVVDQLHNGNLTFYLRGEEGEGEGGRGKEGEREREGEGGREGRQRLITIYIHICTCAVR